MSQSSVFTACSAVVPSLQTHICKQVRHSSNQIAIGCGLLSVTSCLWLQQQAFQLRANHWGNACPPELIDGSFLKVRAPVQSLEYKHGANRISRVYNSLWSAGLLLTHSKPVAWCGCVPKKQHVQHATAIPSRTYPFSSDQGSQTGLGSTSTRLSDRPGTLSAVVSCLTFCFCCVACWRV